MCKYNTGIVSLVLKSSKTSFTPCHTITEKGIAYVRPFDSKLPLRPVEVEFENNRCCLEVNNTSDSTIEFSYGHEMAYFDARSKGLVHINNSKHFPLDLYLHDRVTPVTLSHKPLTYDKPEMPCISTCTEMTTEDTNCAVPIPCLNMDCIVFVGCHLFSCSCCSINALGNVVRVYPEIIQGLMFYRSKI